ncbi:hypothetical protein BDV09DRAFT_177376 [Aspergillus tetrazonus]
MISDLQPRDDYEQLHALNSPSMLRIEVKDHYASFLHYHRSHLHLVLATEGAFTALYQYFKVFWSLLIALFRFGMEWLFRNRRSHI